jgi:hypothetical protein
MRPLVFLTSQRSDGACMDVSCGSWSTALLFKAGFQPSTARPRDGTGVSVMPLCSAAAANSSIFDDESHSRDGDVEFKRPIRGTDSLSPQATRSLTPVLQHPSHCLQRSLRVCSKRNRTLMTCNITKLNTFLLFIWASFVPKHRTSHSQSARLQKRSTRGVKE